MFEVAMPHILGLRETDTDVNRARSRYDERVDRGALKSMFQSTDKGRDIILVPVLGIYTIHYLHIAMAQHRNQSLGGQGTPLMFRHVTSLSVSGPAAAACDRCEFEPHGI
jgi:hypothetical protein